MSNNFAIILKNFMKQFLKTLKQFLKKFYVKILQVKCGKMLIKIYPPFE